MQEQTTKYFPAVSGSEGVHYGPLKAYRDGSLGTNGGPLRAFQDGSLGVLEGVGALGKDFITTSPIIAAAKAMQGRKQHHAISVNGVDDSTLGMIGSTTFFMVVGGLLLVSGALSYQAGKAMAPNKQSASTWGWAGVPVGMLTGSIGLGVMGIISNSKK